MGLFDQFKKKNTEEKEPVSVSETDETNAAPGWDAITSAFEKLYPGQTNPKHYAPIISMRIGGNDPLDGISVYDGGEYWHFVTYGFSELYEKESEDQEYSGYGMEFTLKLKKDANADEEAEIRCVCGILQSLARLTFTKGEVFLPNEYIYTRQTEGVDADRRSNITGFITIAEPKVPEIRTPNGIVVFVELVGATDAELKAIYNQELRVKELYERLGSDVTDYHRKSVV